MSEPSPVDYLKDPLSEITRKERRNSLILSTVGILVAKAGIIPTKFTTLGIQLTAPAQDTFVILVGLCVLYFVSTFMVYAFSDLLIWRKTYQDYLIYVEKTIDSWTEEEQRYHDEIHRNIPNINWVYAYSKPTAFIRVSFEFLIPIIFGITSFVFLVQTVWFP